MTKFYLLRKAASVPEAGLPEELWPLSLAGQEAARKLVSPLGSLGIRHIYASTERGAIETVQPFAQVYGLKILVLNELQEHKIEPNETRDLSPMRCKVWEDFDFAPDKFESSRVAQRRIVRTIQSLMLHHQDEVIVICLASDAIALFLNAIDPGFTLKTWQMAGIPEIVRLSREEYRLAWDRLENKASPLSLVGKNRS